ncbi:hypothetical protein N7456_002781 [Penicillium angulare]|uniref:Uncharacterized protein n=1 Tax=Penicillium angulare TaxID=116970 RepID=A0A9W9FTE0_9EURO|nr:hypothetical protein N7456_002781 [Penicillium angulare]
MTRNENQSYITGANRNASYRKGDTEDCSGKIAGDLSNKEGHGESYATLIRPTTYDKKRQIQKHFRRFWCCYLVAGIVFLAIFLPILAYSCYSKYSKIYLCCITESFLVIIPAIAQRIVENTALPVYSAEILDPKEGSVSFTLQTSLKIPAGIRVRTNPFNLSLVDRNVKSTQPYLSAYLPSYSLHGTTHMKITQNNTSILNEAEFVQTLSEAVFNEKFTLSAKGSTLGHLGALKAHITLDKDIKLDGLDKLKGFAIDSAQLVIPKEDDGTNFVGTATLPNHSVFTFALGNVTLNLQSFNLDIGQATILNAVLKPGNNTVSLRGKLYIDTLVDNISEIVSSQRESLLNGTVQLSASGNSTIYNGVHIPYYEKVLNNLTLTTQVPILEVLTGTLEGLLNQSNNSTLASIVQNITEVLGNVDKSTDFTRLAQSLVSLHEPGGI